MSDDGGGCCDSSGGGCDSGGGGCADTGTSDSCHADTGTSHCGSHTFQDTNTGDSDYQHGYFNNHHTSIDFPNVGHSFMNDTNDSYSRYANRNNDGSDNPPSYNSLFDNAGNRLRNNEINTSYSRPDTNLRSYGRTYNNKCRRTTTSGDSAIRNIVGAITFFIVAMICIAILVMTLKDKKMGVHEYEHIVKDPPRNIESPWNLDDEHQNFVDSLEKIRLEIEQSFNNVKNRSTAS